MRLNHGQWLGGSRDLYQATKMSKEIWPSKPLGCLLSGPELNDLCGRCRRGIERFASRRVSFSPYWLVLRVSSVCKTARSVGAQVDSRGLRGQRSGHCVVGLGATWRCVWGVGGRGAAWISTALRPLLPLGSLITLWLNIFHPSNHPPSHLTIISILKQQSLFMNSNSLNIA